MTKNLGQSNGLKWRLSAAKSSYKNSASFKVINRNGNMDGVHIGVVCFWGKEKGERRK